MKKKEERDTRYASGQMLQNTKVAALLCLGKCVPPHPSSRHHHRPRLHKPSRHAATQSAPETQRRDQPQHRNKRRPRTSQHITTQHNTTVHKQTSDGWRKGACRAVLSFVFGRPQKKTTIKKETEPQYVSTRLWAIGGSLLCRYSTAMSVSLKIRSTCVSCRRFPWSWGASTNQRMDGRMDKWKERYIDE